MLTIESAKAYVLSKMGEYGHDIQITEAKALDMEGVPMVDVLGTYRDEQGFIFPLAWSVWIEKDKDGNEYLYGEW